MKRIVRCAECECTPTECSKRDTNGEIKCLNCNKDDLCCCLAIHVAKEKKCCNDLDCKNTIKFLSSGQSQSANDFTGHRDIGHRDNFGLRTFFLYAKGLYAAALGIEILCIAAAEIGENTGLYFFGFNPVGIPIAYVMGYSLAGFTTFVTILGRYSNYGSDKNYTGSTEIDSCCSVLGQDTSQGFVSNTKTTFLNFALGFKRLRRIHEQSGLKPILKSSLIILITAESACILTAETVDLIFYQYSILLSVPLALMAGAFTVVAPAAYRKARRSAANVRS